MSSRRQFIAASGLAALPSLLPCTSQVSPSAPSPKPIRVGQIGTKHGHASGKLGTVLKYPEVFEVVAWTEQDAEQLAKVENTAPFANVQRMSQADLLSQPDLDLVLIEGDIDELLPAARACIDAGKHIHLDKPAGTKLAEFEAILKSAKQKQLLVQLGYMYRSNPAFQLMYEAVADGLLGEVFEVHAVMSKKINAAARKPLARYRGGSMFELGCHLIDSLIILMGKPDRIHAMHRQVGDDGLYDNCLALFEYPKATATVRSSLVEVDGFRRRHFVVCGTKGTLHIEPLDNPKITLTLEESQQSKSGREFNKGTEQFTLPKSPGRYDGDLLALAASIRGESVYPYDYNHDLLVQQCLLQACDMPLE
ncbi:MAG: Gfo/Idh/MocA family oxidoreductase [Planctomycetota bacterium]